MSEPRREHPSTYFVQDRSNIDEMTRLQIQDQMLTASMGGVLPEQADPARFQSVLDVACGTGGWLIEVAKTYPTITRLVGVDINNKLIEYARAQAEEQGIADRVQFRVMDALLILEFLENTFDLVNQRCAGSWLRTLDWPKLLGEYQRVCKSGGTIRVTEPEIIHQSNSLALTSFLEMFQCAMFRSGHLFKEDTNGIIAHLPRLFTQYGFQQVQSRDYALEYRAGTGAGEAYYQNIAHFVRTLRPFLQKWGCVTSDYDEVTQQALTDAQKGDFVSVWSLRTVWGINPGQDFSRHSRD